MSSDCSRSENCILQSLNQQVLCSEEVFLFIFNQTKIKIKKKLSILSIFTTVLFCMSLQNSSPGEIKAKEMK